MLLALASSRRFVELTRPSSLARRQTFWTGQKLIGAVSQSAQYAPYDADYVIRNSTPYVTVYDSDLTLLNECVPPSLSLSLCSSPARWSRADSSSSSHALPPSRAQRQHERRQVRRPVRAGPHDDDADRHVPKGPGPAHARPQRRVALGVARRDAGGVRRVPPEEAWRGARAAAWVVPPESVPLLPPLSFALNQQLRSLETADDVALLQVASAAPSSSTRAARSSTWSGASTIRPSLPLALPPLPLPRPPPRPPTSSSSCAPSPPSHPARCARSYASRSRPRTGPGCGSSRPTGSRSTGSTTRGARRGAARERRSS